LIMGISLNRKLHLYIIVHIHDPHVSPTILASNSVISIHAFFTLIAIFSY